MLARVFSRNVFITVPFCADYLIGLTAKVRVFDSFNLSISLYDPFHKQNKFRQEILDFRSANLIADRFNEVAQQLKLLVNAMSSADGEDLKFISA